MVQITYNLNKILVQTSMANGHFWISMAKGNEVEILETMDLLTEMDKMLNSLINKPRNS